MRGNLGSGEELASDPLLEDCKHETLSGHTRGRLCVRSSPEDTPSSTMILRADLDGPGCLAGDKPITAALATIHQRIHALWNANDSRVAFDCHLEICQGARALWLPFGIAGHVHPTIFNFRPYVGSIDTYTVSETRSSEVSYLSTMKRCLVSCVRGSLSVPLDSGGKWLSNNRPDWANNAKPLWGCTRKGRL